MPESNFSAVGADTEHTALLNPAIHHPLNIHPSGLYRVTLSLPSHAMRCERGLHEGLHYPGYLYVRVYIHISFTRQMSGRWMDGRRLGVTLSLKCHSVGVLFTSAAGSTTLSPVMQMK